MSCTFRENADDERHKSGDLKKAALITLLYFAVEMVTGYWTHSSAMVGDSIHMFADGIVLVLMFWVYKARSLSPRNSVVGYLSFGFRRLELLTIILNTVLVGTAISWILIESYRRLKFGQVEVIAWPMLLVGTLGFVVNMMVFRTLNVHSYKEEGIKSAIACALTDALSPIVIVAGSLAILVSRRLYWFDTVAALIIAGILVWSFRSVPKSIFSIIMEAVPPDIGFEKVLASIKQVYGVDDVLDLHINKIGSGLVVLTSRVSIKSHVLHDFIPGLVQTQLKEEFPELKNVHLTIETVCSTDPT